MELVNCKECDEQPNVEMFYGETYIRCHKCKKMTRDYEYARDAFIEWNEMN